MSKILSIVVPSGFQQKEYLESRRALEEGGHEVRVASVGRTAIDKTGEEYDMDLALEEVREKDFDAILFVGGPGTADYFDDPDFHQLAKNFYSAGKLTTAICAAPVILGRAGLLRGKKATSFPGETESIQNNGAIYTGSPVEQDGLIITADGPDSAYDFGLAISEALKH